MSVPQAIGPEVGSLIVRTFREGIGALVGHDLVLLAKAWSGVVTIDADDPLASTVAITVESASLELNGTTGGLKPISKKDRRDIRRTIQRELLHTDDYPEIAFRSTGVTGTLPELVLRGDLTITNATKPVSIAVTVASSVGGYDVRGQTALLQSEFGIKPYSAMFGALKVRDRVELEVSLHLPNRR